NNRWDYNKDNQVDAIDVILARTMNNQVGELIMISVANPPHAPVVGQAANDSSLAFALALSALAASSDSATGPGWPVSHWQNVDLGGETPAAPALMLEDFDVLGGYRINRSSDDSAERARLDDAAWDQILADW